MTCKLMPACRFVFRLTVTLILCVLAFTGCNTKTQQPRDYDYTKDPRILAINFLQSNKFDEAETAFKKAIKADPENILNYGDLSLLYLAKKNYEQAEKQAKAGLNIQPGNAGLKLTLSEIYLGQGNREEAAKQLQEIIAADPRNAPAYYKLASMAAADKNYSAQKSNLVKLVDIDPSNIVPKLILTELFAREGQPDSALFYMQSIKKIVPEFTTAIDTIYRKASTIITGNNPSGGLYYLQRLHQLLQLTEAYAAGLEQVDQPKLLSGYSEFNDSKFNQVYEKNRIVTLQDISFAEASTITGLTIPGAVNAAHSTLALADDDGKGTSYVFVSFLQKDASVPARYLFEGYLGNFKDITALVDLKYDAIDFDAKFADYDNDGYKDLLVSTSKGIFIYRNNGDGTFSRKTGDTGLNKVTDGSKLLIADFDQDGDLDLYVGCKGANKFFRNNNDGTFTENAKPMNLSGNASGTIALDYGDWDADGDLDIAMLAGDGSLQLYNNNRHSVFENFTDSLHLRQPGCRGTAIAFGDYNNDGLPDLCIGGGKNEATFLLKNNGTNGFVVDTTSALLTRSLKGITAYAVIFFDFDNDGYQDILVAGEGQDSSSPGVQLFHNENSRGFTNVSYLLPSTLTAGHTIETADFNLDGDDDLFISAPSGIHLIRNDGGNLNHYMQIQLTGLSYGNNKNNRFSVGAQVELKAGDLYQTKTIRRTLVNFGVGSRDSLDVVRIIWPNGTPELINDPSRWQRTLEQEKLKGSCPFLFVWNGERYEFLKDMMWRSALGMPLSVNGTDTVYAFSDASKEYLLIPGEKLKARNNVYSLRITEELWEAVYFDKASLVAVDHPDTVEVYADERFVLPPFPGKNVYRVSTKYLPVSATDQNGVDLLSRISAYDFNYISNFGLGKYQGLAEDHDLVIDLGDKAKGDSMYLFLRGWTYPTDASINTSMSQSSDYRIRAPDLEVVNSRGEWQKVIPDIGFPMGKDKMVIVNLSGKFLRPDSRKVRIRTNMQVYWDEIFFSKGLSRSPVRM
ncbi:MAG TPA: FG-GAP-like repeat-containing protein, partial [Agriterribacter sp.]|nr:FG-GAP-like repeat-containing protein [Agriterribacter sp.]